MSYSGRGARNVKISENTYSLVSHKSKTYWMLCMLATPSLYFNGLVFSSRLQIKLYKGLWKASTDKIKRHALNTESFLGHPSHVHYWYNQDKVIWEVCVDRWGWKTVCKMNYNLWRRLNTLTRQMYASVRNSARCEQSHTKLALEHVHLMLLKQTKFHCNLSNCWSRYMVSHHAIRCVRTCAQLTLQMLCWHEVVTGLCTRSWQQMHVNSSSTFCRYF